MTMPLSSEYIRRDINYWLDMIVISKTIIGRLERIAALHPAWQDMLGTAIAEQKEQIIFYQHNIEELTCTISSED